jgi:BirA family transcriptional regulator, biotin operon repressor / biotin---[acetyl-CoA-carboxylase] ligase
MIINIDRLMVNEVGSRILQALRDAGDHISGEKLAGRLGVSRGLICKHIHKLQQYGYAIDTSRRGYALMSSPDLLLPYEFPGLEQRIHYFDEIDSTMDAARELAKAGADEGTIVIAERQTRGRGRLNREWFSPEGGIYFTFILRPRISPTYATRINVMASVAVATSIRRHLGLNAVLKWPNDVLIEGKKVCGILAEIDAGIDAVHFVNLGIGINANTQIHQPEETATSLRQHLGRDVSRSEFLSSLLKEIEHWQMLLMEPDLLEEWRRMSTTLGTDVTIVMHGETMAGIAVDIDSTGALLVRERNGSIRKAVAGDCFQASLIL